MSLFVLQISIVSQEPVLFAESIAYNIAFGMPGGLQGVSMEQVNPNNIREKSKTPHLDLKPLHVSLQG